MPSPYDDFRNELDAILASTSGREFAKRITAKVLDLLARRPLSEDFEALFQDLDELFRGELNPLHNAALRHFNEILGALNTHYTFLSDIDLTRDFARVQAIERSLEFYLGDYGDDTIVRIHQTLREAHEEEDSHSEITTRLKSLEARVASYADTITNTHLMNVVRVGKVEKARLGDVFHFKYVGLRRDSIRPFCSEHLNQTYHIDEINEMNNGNRNPVLENCGGWNCIHEWEPVPDFLL